MTSTTYYNLNIVEGTDIVNPLVVDNPNYEKIDEAMHNNAVAGVTLATEIANATVHAITRENSDCAVIRFIATSEWKAGDTATVDGVPVTTLLPSGETLPDGAYVINANVLGILTGTNLTVYLGSKKVENANEIPFNDTTVGAELVKLDGEIVRQDREIVNLNGKIDNVNSKIPVMEAGAFEAQHGNGSNGYYETTVPFKNTFESVPYITVSIVDSTIADSILIVKTVTNANFTVRLKSSTLLASSGKIKCNYIAVLQ